MAKRLHDFLQLTSTFAFLGVLFPFGGAGSHSVDLVGFELTELESTPAS